MRPSWWSRASIRSTAVDGFAHYISIGLLTSSLTIRVRGSRPERSVWSLPWRRSRTRNRPRPGRAVRVGRSRYAHPDAIGSVRARVEAVIAAKGSITLARLRDELGTSRQFAQALLEHLDAERVTHRGPGDAGVLRRRPRPAPAGE
jgi:hypothetical protein